MPKTFEDQTRPLLLEFVKSLVLELEGKGTIVRSSPKDADVVRYKISPKIVTDEEIRQPSVVSTRDIFKELFEFRNIIIAIYRQLDESVANADVPLSRMISKLIDLQAITAQWRNSQELLDIIDKMDSLTGDEALAKRVEKIITDNNISLNNSIRTAIQFFGETKAIDIFYETGYRSASPRSESERKIDLILRNPDDSTRHTIIIEYKWRRQSALPIKDNILKFLNRIRTINGNEIDRSLFILVVFTIQPTRGFDKATFQFKQILRDNIEFENLEKKIFFLPVSIDNLGLMTRQLQDFVHNNIRFNRKVSFRDQTPPRSNPDRNDHFFDKIFEFKKCTFKIGLLAANSQYWRFGFQFSESYDFPPITSGRHGDNRYASIQIAVGELTEIKGVRHWHRDNLLYFESYQLGDNNVDSKVLGEYEGQSLLINWSSNPTGSEAYFEIMMQGMIIKTKVFNLSRFNYCRIYAWCDYHEFELEADIMVDYHL